MKLTIVANKQGRHVIVWKNYILLGLLLSTVFIVGVGCTFYLLAGRWNQNAFTYGLFMAVGMMALAAISGLKTPVQKLKKL